MTGLPGLKCVTDNVRCSAQPWSSSPTGREHAALQPWGAAQEPGFGARSCHGMGLLGRGQKRRAPHRRCWGGGAGGAAASCHLVPGTVQGPGGEGVAKTEKVSPCPRRAPSPERSRKLAEGQHQEGQSRSSGTESREGGARSRLGTRGRGEACFGGSPCRGSRQRTQVGKGSVGSRDTKKSGRSGQNAESREGWDDGGRRRASGRPQRQVLLRAELAGTGTEGAAGRPGARWGRRSGS